MVAAELSNAVTSLQDGGVIAYPTEAVFGLGCDPANDAAVTRVLTLKQRPVDKGLILIAAQLDALQPWLAPLDPTLRGRVEPSWPGPATWLLPAAADCPRRLCGDHDTLAVRVTAHPVAAALCQAWGSALVSTSANSGGEVPLRDAETVHAHLGHGIDAIVEGSVGNQARPTPIRDARSGHSVRE